MKAIRIFSIVIAFLFAATILAQSGTQSGPEHGLPSVDEQMKILNAKLDLTSDQQEKIKPIMQDLHDATLKIMREDKLSRDEQLAKVRPLRISAGNKLRQFLTDEQKKKLDLYLSGPHHEMHGDLEGKPKSSTQPK